MSPKALDIVTLTLPRYLRVEFRMSENRAERRISLSRYLRNSGHIYLRTVAIV